MQSPTPGWSPQVLTASSMEGRGWPEIWSTMQRFIGSVEYGIDLEPYLSGRKKAATESDPHGSHGNAPGIHGDDPSPYGLSGKRALQRKQWMWRNLQDSFVAKLKQDARIRQLASQLERDVYAGRTTPGQAADEILESFCNK